MHTRRSCLKGSALLALYAWAGAGSLAMSESLRGLAASVVVIDTGLPEATRSGGPAGRRPGPC